MGWKDLQRRFRNLYKENFSRISLRAFSPTPVEAKETLSRFITSSRWYSRTKGEVKHAAFMPAGNGETSLFRTDGLDENNIWLLGQEQLGRRLSAGRHIHGRGDIRAQEIYAVALRVEPEISLHPLHANIVNWPSDEPRRLFLAAEIARKATLQLL
jgi:hypothetical protein